MLLVAGTLLSCVPSELCPSSSPLNSFWDNSGGPNAVRPQIYQLGSWGAFSKRFEMPSRGHCPDIPLSLPRVVVVLASSCCV